MPDTLTSLQNELAITWLIISLLIIVILFTVSKLHDVKAQIRNIRLLLDKPNKKIRKWENIE